MHPLDFKSTIIILTQTCEKRNCHLNNIPWQECLIAEGSLQRLGFRLLAATIINMIHRSICNDLRKNLDKFKHKELLFYFAYILSNTSQIQLFISLSILLKYFFIDFSNLYQFLSILHHTSHNSHPILFIFTALHTTISLYFCYHPHWKTKVSRPI